MILVDDNSEDEDGEISEDLIEVTSSKREEEVAFSLEKTISSFEEDFNNSDQDFAETNSEVIF